MCQSDQCALKAILVNALDMLASTVRLIMQEEQAALKAQRPDEAIDNGSTLCGGAQSSRPAPAFTSNKQSDVFGQPADVKQAAPDKPLPQQKSAATPARDTQQHYPGPAEENDKESRLVRCLHML